MSRKARLVLRLVGIFQILILMVGFMPVGRVLAEDDGLPAGENEPDAGSFAETPGGAGDGVPIEETAPGEASITEEAPLPDEDTADEPSLDEPTVEEAIAVAVELLAEEGVVIEDETGSPVPLVSDEAADILAVPDPMYCPPGAPYGDASCSPARATMAEAISDASGNGGTIYVEGGTFDGFTLTGFNGADLLIVGGVGGGTTLFDSQVFISNNSANITLSGFSIEGSNSGFKTDGTGGGIFDDTPALLALGNTGKITLDYLIIEHDDDTAIFIDDHSGAVELNAVKASSDGNDLGTYIDNTNGDGDVTVVDSKFESEDSDGLKIKSAGSVLLDDVTASGNGDDGADIDNTAGDKNVSVMHSVFNLNKDYGLKIKSNGFISLYHVVANDNKEIGAYLETTGETIVVKDSEFSDTEPGCEWVCTKWRDGQCKQGYTVCEPDYSQDIGLKVVNLNETFHETTLCGVVAKFNDFTDVKLVSPNTLGEFIYNICNLEVHDRYNFEEIRIYGGHYEECNCPEGFDYVGGGWCKESSPCDGQCGWERKVCSASDNITVNYWNLGIDSLEYDVYEQFPVTFNEQSEVCCSDCEQPLCGDGFVQLDEQCDDGNDINNDACSNTCTVDWRVDLELDPYCVPGDGNYLMQWVINNPNAFNVAVNWSLSDGQNGAAVLSPGTNFITTSELGTWTLTVSWAGGGEGELTSTITSCEDPGGGDGGDTPEFTGGGLLIPVTGEDLTAISMIPFGGSLLLGMALLVKGLYGKIRK